MNKAADMEMGRVKAGFQGHWEGRISDIWLLIEHGGGERGS